MPKPLIAPIVGPRLRLRLLEADDLPMTLSWRNQDAIRCWFKNPEPIQPEQHRAWFSRYIERDDDFLFVIEENDRLDRPIGQVGIYGIDRGERTAEFGRILIGDPEARGAGYAREATTLMVGFALGHWGLREVYLEVFAGNTRALQVYRRCGFLASSEEGGLVRMHVTPERLAAIPRPSVDRVESAERGSGDDPSGSQGV